VIDSGPIRFWGGSQNAPSIGIQTTQRSIWYSKQVDQIIIYKQKQIDTYDFQIPPAPPNPKKKTSSDVFFLWLGFGCAHALATPAQQHLAQQNSRTKKPRSNQQGF
jgi:hypothetical protein